MKKQLLSDMDFTIVTPSKWLENRVKLSFLKDKNICVIHNGIDTDIFKCVNIGELKEELSIPTENKVVLALAPNIMSEAKGGKWVLDLAKRFIDKKITFILVGDTGKEV